MMLINFIWAFGIGMLFAIFEIIVDKYDDTIFPQGKSSQYFNPILSWKNKYTKFNIPIPSGLYGSYHRYFNLKYKERFFLSGTALVFLTDFRHLIKILLVMSIVGLAIMYTPIFGIWLDWVMFLTFILGIFEVFYSKILIK